MPKEWILVEKVAHYDSPKTTTDAKTVVSAIRTGATVVFNSEPDLARWNTIVGDGDCGETCTAGAKAVLDASEGWLWTDGELESLLRELTKITDGTFFIYLTH
jgi:dihydroxyacetone kinase